MTRPRCASITKRACAAARASCSLAGAASEVWLRRKMRELQKIAGYGRTGPPPALAICLLEPRTPEKDRFRTHEGLVVRAWDQEADPLAPFIAGLDGGREGRG